LGFLFKKESRKQAILQLRIRDTSRYSFHPLSTPLFIEVAETIKFYPFLRPLACRSKHAHHEWLAHENLKRLEDNMVLSVSGRGDVSNEEESLGWLHRYS
jgi:hypothetical protein